MSELHPSFMALQYTLLFLYGEDRFHLLYGKDHVIFAELPSEVDDWIVFEAVRRYMMHGPCGELNPSNSFLASTASKVAKVLVEEGMEVEKGQPMFVLNLPVPLGSIMSQHVYLDDPQYNPMEGLGIEDNFLKRTKLKTRVIDNAAVTRAGLVNYKEWGWNFGRMQ
ncbi:hypothetical protein Tco_1000264 [Tanacetum coccineum]